MEIEINNKDNEEENEQQKNSIVTFLIVCEINRILIKKVMVYIKWCFD